MVSVGEVPEPDPGPDPEPDAGVEHGSPYIGLVILTGR